MSIDKSRIRQKLAQLNGTAGAAADYWSPPKEGRATIRMFPYPHSDDPFLEYYFHFNIGRTSILCPKKNGLGSDCPVCDLAADCYGSDDENDKELSKKLYARQRFYGLVVDRADETLTPKYWGFSKTLYMKFLTWLEEDNGEYENFLDVNSGLDLVVGVQKTPGKMFASAEAEAKRKESPLADSKEKINSILKSVKPASDIFQVMSVEDITKKLNEWANDEKKTEEPPAQDDTKSVTKGKKPPRKSPNEEIENLFDQQLAD